MFGFKNSIVFHIVIDYCSRHSIVTKTSINHTGYGFIIKTNTLDETQFYQKPYPINSQIKAAKSNSVFSANGKTKSVFIKALGLIDFGFPLDKLDVTSDTKTYRLVLVV